MRADAMNTSFLKTPAGLGRIARAAVALGLLSSVVACTDAQKDSDSSSYLTIASLVATPGGSDTSGASTASTALSSDVRTFGAAYSDPMVVTMRVNMKDPTLSTGPTNFITVQKYHVSYTRTDGGPVPASFDAAATFTVGTSDTSSGPITLVKAEAKNQSPLLALAGTAQTIPVTAQVTFDGVDQAGKASSVTGFISITFADFVDPGVDPVTPQAAFTVAPAAGLRSGQQAIFDASTTVVPSGRTITNYTWSFGDGTVFSAGMSPVFQHVFATGGQYLVRLTVTDSAGQTWIAERVIPVV